LVDRRMIDPQYFRVLGIPVIQGRAFTEGDAATGPGVSIVSDEWARRFLPDENPIGKRLKLGGPASGRPWLTIVGVAGDTKHASLDTGARPYIYIPWVQFPSQSFQLTV